MYKVSFTGYRPEKLPFYSEDDPLCLELKARLNKEIKRLILDGAGEFHTGMAQGVDIWAAEEVLKLREEFTEIKLNAVIPCPEQADRWSDESRARYQRILRQCDKRITISPHYDKNCMKKRNYALVDLCDILVAVFDGKKGGTMQTVNYAKSKGRVTVVLSPVFP